MLHVLVPIAALLAGVSILLVGSGLLATLLAVRGTEAGWSDALLGLVLSGYFAGFFLGTFLAPPLIRRIGHIRAFAFCVGIFAMAALLHALTGHAVAWLLLRVLAGVALVGVFTVIESWLADQSGVRNRGQVFAAYMIVTLLALALAQQLLRLDGGEPMRLFVFVGALACLALLPVTWTRLSQPTVRAMPRLRMRTLWRTVPTAVAGAVFSGLASGAFWAMGPVFASRSGFSDAHIASFMSLGILGGALLQWPLGRLSDRHDRRYMLAGVCLVAAALALVGLMPAPAATTSLWLVFAYGGLAFAVYPIAFAHLMDHLEPGTLLQGSSTFLLLHGIGAAVAPVLAGLTMGWLGPGGFWAWLAVVQASLAVFVVSRVVARRRPVEFLARFLPMLRTTPAALAMVPEAGKAEPPEDEDGEGGETSPPAV